MCTLCHYTAAQYDLSDESYEKALDALLDDPGFLSTVEDEVGGYPLVEGLNFRAFWQNLLLRKTFLSSTLRSCTECLMQVMTKQVPSLTCLCWKGPD